jgi:hypothetical protein
MSKIVTATNMKEQSIAIATTRQFVISTLVQYITHCVSRSSSVSSSSAASADATPIKDSVIDSVIAKSIIVNIACILSFVCRFSGRMLRYHHSLELNFNPVAILTSI